MSAYDQLKALASPDRLAGLEQLIKEDVERLWKVYGVLGYTDDEIGFVLKNCTDLELLRRYALQISEEAVLRGSRSKRSKFGLATPRNRPAR